MAIRALARKARLHKSSLPVVFLSQLYSLLPHAFEAVDVHLVRLQIVLQSLPMLTLTLITDADELVIGSGSVV
jgi:hypothetical protein